MTIRLLVSVLLGLASISTSAAEDGASDGGDAAAAFAARQKRFLDQVEPVLLGADSVELLSLDPAQQGDDESALLGWKELGRTRLSAAETTAVAAALRTSVAGSGGALAMCFEARHAIIALHGATKLELLICFACEQAKGTLGGKPLFATIVGVGEAEFDRVLNAARVPLAEKRH